MSTSYYLQELEPPATVTIFISNGTPAHFPIYADQSRKEYLKCDLCGRELRLKNRKNTQGFLSHRESKGCRQGKQKEEIYRARAVIQQNFPNLNSSTANLGPSNSVSTITSNLESTSFASGSSTPRAPFFVPICDQSLPSPSESLPASAASHQDYHNELTCLGQSVQWEPGAVWDSYAFHQHLNSNTMPWDPIRLNGPNQIVLRSKKCSKQLSSAVGDDIKARACRQCQYIPNSGKFKKFMERNNRDELPQHTPWKYMNWRQLRQALTKYRENCNELKLKVDLNQVRTIRRLRPKLKNHQRIVMMLAQNKIAGVSRILTTALRNKMSVPRMIERLEDIIAGVYKPKGGNWGPRELDIAFLIKAYGGPRLLYVMQKANAYPSHSTLRARKKIPELLVSTGQPTLTEINLNILAFLGKEGRQPSPSAKLIGQCLMIDGVALEEVCRYDNNRHTVLGLCREHSTRDDSIVLTMDDINRIHDRLFKTPNNPCHHAKDGTVAAIAPVTSETHYYPVPVLLSGSCKTENADALRDWVSCLLHEYRHNPFGEALHGPMYTLATDGESTFRKVRLGLCLSEDLDRNSEMGQVAYNLPGMNCRTGPGGIIGTSDPKHTMKRMATAIRSPKGIQLGDINITSTFVLESLIKLPNMTLEKAASLLNPADKQNVPKAVNLLESLMDLGELNFHRETPGDFYKLKRTAFLGRIFSFFLLPFVDVQMSLSSQIRSLSTYAHLLTALYYKHRTAFISSALYIDTQSIVKNIILTTARLQGQDKTFKYFILHEGTDRLENLFSYARTHDHARNFDILQLSLKLGIAAECCAIYERHPDLDRGHIRRNLVGARGIDHINPKSWIGDVCVGHVQIVEEYLAGKAEAIKLLNQEFENFSFVDFDLLFSDPDVDHLRPFKNKLYVGLGKDDTDDTEIDESNQLPVADDNQIYDEIDSDLADERDSPSAPNDDFVPPLTDNQPQLNVSEDKPQIFIEVDGKKQHIAAIIASQLSKDGGRKSTLRPLRAQGISLDQTLRKIHPATIEVDLEDKQEGLVKAGDLGAILVQSGGSQQICLAVVEILNFKQNDSKYNKSSIQFDDVDDLSKGTTMAIKILEMKYALDDKEWIWQKSFITITLPKAGEPFSSCNDAIRIPAEDFFPITPSIISDDDNQPVWSVDHAQLLEVLGYLWSALAPTDENILAVINRLPIVQGQGLPYADDLVVKDLPDHWKTISNKVRAANEIVPCQLCSQPCKIKDMRAHVGSHILHSSRLDSEDLLDTNDNETFIPTNPCGWCGREDHCITQLMAKGKKIAVISNCNYHYTKMQYTKASTFVSGKSICTNVPLRCYLCKYDGDGPLPTFWKYNFIHHIIKFHIGENSSLPLEMIVSTHISVEEGEAMGIPARLTVSFRESHDLLNSEDIAAEIDADRARKRASSDTSIGSTVSSSRGPSPSKRMHFS